MAISLFLDGPAETSRLGRLLGRRLAAGAVLALTGPLGAGKTCLTAGLAEGLDVPEGMPVVSPTYTLANEYQGRLPLYHLDAYRLDADEFFASGLDEYFDRPGIVVIEWADRLEGDLPEPRLEIDLAREGQSRRAVLRPVGSEYEEFLTELEESWRLGRW